MALILVVLCFPFCVCCCVPPSISLARSLDVAAGAERLERMPVVQVPDTVLRLRAAHLDRGGQGVLHVQHAHRTGRHHKGVRRKVETDAGGGRRRRKWGRGRRGCGLCRPGGVGGQARSRQARCHVRCSRHPARLQVERATIHDRHHPLSSASTPFHFTPPLPTFHHPLSPLWIRMVPAILILYFPRPVDTNTQHDTRFSVTVQFAVLFRIRMSSGSPNSNSSSSVALRSKKID